MVGGTRPTFPTTRRLFVVSCFAFFSYLICLMFLLSVDRVHRHFKTVHIYSLLRLNLEQQCVVCFWLSFVCLDIFLHLGVCSYVCFVFCFFFFYVVESSPCGGFGGAGFSGDP